uniref:Bile acid:sodium symporter n=2 Tax=Spongospora subterranea TaxID=70186 RepID=A0A0H5RAQ8_9EUKA|eukprot:CRZ11148.1 hypothetical protein [Spongospora subterranea]
MATMTFYRSLRIRWTRWIMPLGLIVALFLGWLWPTPGKYLDDTPLQSICIIVIFIISGLELHLESVRDLVRLWPSATLGLLSILFITPLFALALRHIPVDSFVILGLGVFALSPTTVSTGSVLVAQCRGNMPLSLFFTVFSNVLAVFTIPFLLPVLLLGPNSGVSFTLNPTDILLQLTYLVLIPLCAGRIILRPITIVRLWSERHKLFLKLFCILLLIIIPWMKMSSSITAFNKISAAQIFLTAAIGIAMHLSFIAFNWTMALLCCFKPDVTKAVVIMCSQKTLTVGFAVLASLPNSQDGLYAIPIIIGHLVQLVIDSILASRWDVKDKKSARSMAEPTELISVPPA